MSVYVYVKFLNTLKISAFCRISIEITDRNKERMKKELTSNVRSWIRFERSVSLTKAVDGRSRSLCNKKVDN